MLREKCVLVHSIGPSNSREDVRLRTAPRKEITSKDLAGATLPINSEHKILRKRNEYLTLVPFIQRYAKDIKCRCCWISFWKSLHVPCKRMGLESRTHALPSPSIRKCVCTMRLTATNLSPVSHTGQLSRSCAYSLLTSVEQDIMHNKTPAN